MKDRLSREIVSRKDSAEGDAERLRDAAECVSRLHGVRDDMWSGLLCGFSTCRGSCGGERCRRLSARSDKGRRVEMREIPSERGDKSHNCTRYFPRTSYNKLRYGNGYVRKWGGSRRNQS